MRLFFLFISLFSTPYLFAQKIDYPASFLEKLEQISLDFVTPLESDYRDVFVLKNEVQGYDFAIRSRKEKIEIRYIINAASERDPLSNVPGIQFVRMLTQLASNDDGSGLMAIHDVAETELSEMFQADWGKFAYFQPKGTFSNWEHAKLLSLYKADRGIVHILFLFKKPSIDLDNRFYAVQFRAQ